MILLRYRLCSVILGSNRRFTDLSGLGGRLRPNDDSNSVGGMSHWTLSTDIGISAYSFAGGGVVLWYIFSLQLVDIPRL